MTSTIEYNRFVFVIIVVIVAYIISAMAVWRHEKIALAKNGRWEDLYLTFFGKIFKFIPVLNTLFAIIYWIWFNPRKKPKHDGF